MAKSDTQPDKDSFNEDIGADWPSSYHLKAYRDAIDVNTISSITDPNGTIIYANKNFCQISKYSKEELIGKNHRIICSGYHPKEFFNDLWKTISSGKTWHGEIQNRAKDGTLYWVDTVIIPVFNDQNSISYYLSLRTLITGRKEAEKQKDDYVRTLEDIAFIVAHRVRGPVCSIEGLVNLLEQPDSSVQNNKITLEHLRVAVNELDNITHELSHLLYTREVHLRTKDYEDKISKNRPSES